MTTIEPVDDLGYDAIEASAAVAGDVRNPYPDLAVVRERTPIQRGEIIEAIAKVVYVGRTSMIVRIHIYAEHPLIGDRRICTTGYFSMVALDQAGQPVPVPRLLLDDGESRVEWAVGEEVRRSIDARRK